MLEMFLEQQTNILEWFLKDHVTLKTNYENSVLTSHIGINAILNYINIYFKH